jgi:hypothetical protein
MSSIQGGGSAFTLLESNEIRIANEENRRHRTVTEDMVLDNDVEREFLPILHLPSNLKDVVMVNHREVEI